MTDKPIIIYGVDVSGCEFLIKTGHCKAQMSIMGTDTNKCKCFPNCYYKQLKRKEQSEVRLVKQIQTICDFINNRPEIFKGIYGGVDKIITEYAERKEQECEELTSKCGQLKQTLAEIKYIAEENIRIADLERLNGVYRRGLAEQILQKISESEMGNE